jgi:hypothetical protein
MTTTTVEVMWIQALLQKLGCQSSKIPSLWCDNLSVTFLIVNPVFHAHTKHIELDYHFV